MPSASVISGAPKRRRSGMSAIGTHLKELVGYIVRFTREPPVMVYWDQVLLFVSHDVLIVHSHYTLCPLDSIGGCSSQPHLEDYEQDQTSCKSVASANQYLILGINQAIGI